MGSDKAFLKFKGETFVSSLTSELRKVSDDIIVSIGERTMWIRCAECVAISVREIAAVVLSKASDIPCSAVLS